MSKKERDNKKEVHYYCPCCGNPAPFMLYTDKPIRCHYCKTSYRRDDRIKGG